MTLRLTYLLLCQVLRWLALLARSSAAKDAELLMRATRSQCCAARRPSRGSTGQTGRCWPGWCGCCPVQPGGACSSSRRRCWDGIATWSDAAGPTPVSVAVRLWRPGSASWCCGCQGEPDLGYRRVHGELCRLGYRDRIGASTVWTILQRAGVAPAPTRSALTWRQFLRAQAKGVLAVDFLHRGHGVPAAAVCAVCDRGGDPPGSTCSG